MRWIVVALFVFAAATVRADEPALRWTREPWGRGGGALLAIAADLETGRVAFADVQGVTLALPGEPGQRVARTPGVTDLAFDSAGALWIAAASGLWRRGPEAAAPVERHSPGTGEAARRVRRVALAAEMIAVATDAGIFVSPAGRGRVWTRVNGAAPRTAGSAVGLRCRDTRACELWWLAGSGVWRAELEVRADGLRVRDVRKEIVAGAPVGVAPLDLLLDSSAAPVVVLYPRALAMRAQGDDARWTVWRPVMPPGARARRLETALGSLWLATDRGLLRATDPRLGWSRAAVPAGRLATTGIASDGRQLFNASANGVLRGALGQLAPATAQSGAVVRHEAAGPATTASAPAPRAAATVRPAASGPVIDRASEPAVGRIQRLALEHLGLQAERSRALRARVSRRSWWPQVGLAVGYAGDRSIARDFDQTFVSGDTRHLFDRDLRQGEDWDAGVSLHWDLADAVFDPEIIDLAREERQWIALRDDVLDEINQLYFERRRVLLDFEAQPDPHALEALRLQLRARELAAGLDAWTGGGFTRLLASAHPDRHQE